MTKQMQHLSKSSLIHLRLESKQQHQQVEIQCIQIDLLESRSIMLISTCNIILNYMKLCNQLNHCVIVFSLSIT